MHKILSNWLPALALAAFCLGGYPLQAQEVAKMATIPPQVRTINPADWYEFHPATDDFSPSVLDCSNFVEAPTGKHGIVQVKGDKFVFADGTPVRFWGAQFGGGRGGDLDYAVQRIRKQGFNLVRQHGLDNLSARNSTSTLTYDAAAFDRLDNLIAKLGEQGIYIILDADYYLPMKSGDGIAGLAPGVRTEFLMFVDDKIAKIKRQRMVDIFTKHVNPYTKKTYAEDPTVAMIEVCNEDSMFWHGVDKLAEPFKTQLEAKYKEWLTKKYKDQAGLVKAWTVAGATSSTLTAGEGLGAGERMAMIAMWEYGEDWLKRNPQKMVRGQDQLRFLLELEDQYFLGTQKMLRDAGVKVPICGTNWKGGGFSTRVHLLGQSRLDYVDRHGYWDHPQGEGNTKWRIATCRFVNQPMVKAVTASQDPAQENNVGNLVLSKAWEQVLGKPTTVSEWNTCLPNEYSLEGPGLMTAYGMLQGWDGPLEFAYDSAVWPETVGPASFNLLGNPPEALQLHALAAMWHRQDVAEGELVAETLYDPENIFEMKEDHRPLPMMGACVGKVGYRFVDKPGAKPVVKDITKYWDPKTLTAKSMTGELMWNASKGLVTIDTPRSQGAIGFLSSTGAVDLKSVRLDTTTPFGALYVTAMDGDKPIASAKRLLVTAIGPARNTGMEYEVTAEQSQEEKAPLWRLKSVGQAPILLEAIVGSLQIRSDLAGKCKAWILDVNGKRLSEIPLGAGDKGTLTLPLKAESKTMYYEIAAE